MSTPTVYVLCDCHNQYEGMTKEQIVAAIAEATGNVVTNVDDAFITKIKEQNANGQVKLWVGTTAEFNAITTKAADTLYILTDDDTAEDLDNLASSVSALSEELTDVIGGTIEVAEAAHATTADSATSASTATEAAAIQVTDMPIVSNECAITETGIYLCVSHITFPNTTVGVRETKVLYIYNFNDVCVSRLLSGDDVYFDMTSHSIKIDNHGGDSILLKVSKISVG